MGRKTDTSTIKKLMVDKNYKNITALSNASGVSRPTLGRMLEGKLQPQADTIFLLAKALDIPLGDIGKIFFTEGSAK